MESFNQIVLIISFLIHGVLKSLVIGGMPVLMMTYYRGISGENQEYYRVLAKGMSRIAPLIFGLAVLFGAITWVIVRSFYDWSLTSIFGSYILGWAVLVSVLSVGGWGIVLLQWRNHDTVKRQWIIGSMVMSAMFIVTGVFVSSHLEIFMPSSEVTQISGKARLDAGLSIFWPRLLHTIFGGVAIVGIVLTMYGSLRPQCQQDHEVDPAPYDIRLVRYGVGWALAGTVPQVVVGPWFLLVLPAEVRFHLIDGTSVVSLIFFVSLTLTLLALVLLNSSLMIPHKRGLVWGGLGSLILTTVFMVLIREEVRRVWMSLLGESVDIGQLSWTVVMVVLAFVFVGLFIGVRYVTLTHKHKMSC